jgi:hypothetical protein
MKNTRTYMNTRIASFLAALLLAATAAFPATPDGRAFATPDEAVKALVAALKANDDKALVEIFGERNKDLIVTTDKAASTEYRQKAVKAFEEYLLQQKNADGSITLVIGGNGWPMPIPLVKDGSGWRFDTDKGADEIINRRVGENELNAIEVMRAYPGAQRQFAAKPRDGSNVRSFARRILSTEGKQDGLYWTSDPAKGEEASPFGPLVADGAKRDRGDPYHGYYFKILTGQGPSAPGGKYSYVINGRMVAGFALVAWPADYASSGVKTFIVNHYGDVYQKDLGANTAATARAMTEFNPDKTWTKTTD